MKTRVIMGVTGLLAPWLLGSGSMIQLNVTLPQRIGDWVQADSVGRVDAGSIFDYMDGAGELYLGYRFDSLRVHGYRHGDEEILVELYFMATPDDAFGLLSLDWGGDPVALNSGSAAADGYPQALYGAGLLRLRAGSLYGRIMAYRETGASRAAVLEIGRCVAGSQPPAPPPRMAALAHIPAGSRLRIEPGGLSFLRSHLVLNSLHYLASGNILELDHRTEAIFLRLQGDGGESRPTLALVVAYPAREQAHHALDHFRRDYLPDQPRGEGTQNYHHLEEGWMGYRLSGRHLMIMLSGPDAAVGHEWFDIIDQNIERGGAR